jgi:hypothetical protein
LPRLVFKGHAVTCRCGKPARYSTDDKQRAWCRDCLIGPVSAHVARSARSLTLRMRQNDPAGTWSFEGPTYTLEGQ